MMSSFSKITSALDKLSKFRSDSFEVVKGYIDFVVPMVAKAQELKMKEDDGTISDEEKILIKFYDAHFEDFKTALNKISQYNDSVSDNYIKAIDLLGDVKENINNADK
ncbi:Uncharacterised protein [Citrobacter freundii]|uniref:hypothetical protein n=1 Tax=Citrobacter freundii TaxID=546 RepID=UPI000DF0F381|nr:hypothetical protein [Citrobacter freundii]STB11764.1 Uncharacterised protein [Citrobacter freundii]